MEISRKLEPPKKGFSVFEFEGRLLRAHSIMHKYKLDALFLTMPANIRYFTGFDTQFFHSPTRPWFLVIPYNKKPIAVIPEIGKTLMEMTWVEDIRTWDSPNPNDDGISLLFSVFKDLKIKFNSVGAELGMEMSLRMPWIDFNKLLEKQKQTFLDATQAIWEIRTVKTKAEINHINFICKAVSSCYYSLPKIINLGETERQVSEKLKKNIIDSGADSIPFMPVVSGQNGVSQIISGPSDKELEKGDLLFIDTGSTYDGYFCDFDRNYAIGNASDEVREVYDLLWLATEAGIKAATPGATTGDVWLAINKIIEDKKLIKNNVGRLGHGLGLQLTEPPSHSFKNETKILENMVLTIEPGLEYLPGKLMVHEENILVTKDGPQLLTTRAPKELPIIN